MKHSWNAKGRARRKSGKNKETITKMLAYSHPPDFLSIEARFQLKSIALMLFLIPKDKYMSYNRLRTHF